MPQQTPPPPPPPPQLVNHHHQPPHSSAAPIHRRSGFQQPESPRIKAGWLSQLFFSWMLPLLQRGFRRPLTLEDVYRVLPEDESRVLGDALEVVWKEELRNHKHPSLTRALIRVYGKSYAAYGIYAFYEECIIKVCQPICLGLLLRYFASPSAYPSYSGYLFALAVVLLSVVYTSSDHPFTFAVQHLGMKMRISLCSLLYRKCLRMSRSALEETTPGQIVNFLSSDMNRFDVLLTFLHYIWVAPIQLGFVIGVMYVYIGVGWPCLAGIALIIVFVPFQGLMGNVFSKLRAEVATRTDTRLILMDQILQSIRTIKLYAWERVFIKQVQDARALEVNALKKTAYCKSLNQAMFFVTSRVTLFLTLLTYVLSGKTLSSEIVFVSLALYNSVQLLMTLFFPAAIASLAESRVAVLRFQEFLLHKEFHKPLAPTNLEDDDEDDDSEDSAEDDDDTSKRKLSTNGVPRRSPRRPTAVRSGKGRTSLGMPSAAVEGSLSSRYLLHDSDPLVGIDMSEVTAQWNPFSKDMAFNEVSLRVRSGEIVALIGPVGSGKGSVIQTILHELPVLSGSLKVRGSVAYAAQEPWIFPGSVRENILFGNQFNSDWYDRVVDACALNRDIQLLPYGDHTLVGDRGASLSGGQKARINLARAVYSDADVYLLDDPLAAVDAEVGRKIVTQCILGLLKDKARVLVTHQLQYLSSMSEIILLVDGSVSFKGDYTQLLSSGIPFTELLLTRIGRTASGGGPAGSPRASHQPIAVPVTGSSAGLGMSHHASSSTLVLDNTIAGKMALTPDVITYDSVGVSSGPDSNVLTATKNKSLVAAAATGSAGGDIVIGGISGLNSKEEEEEEELVVLGGLGWKLYWTYMSAGSSILALVLVLIIALATQVLFTSTDLWLQFWIVAEEKTPPPPGPPPPNATSPKNNSSSPDNSWWRQVETSRSVQIGVYSFLVTSLFVLCLTRSANFYRVCMQSSTDLHSRLFFAVIRSPIAFFENNPIGRILNRFAKDLGVLDETLPPVLFDTLEIFLQTLGVIFIVSSSSPVMLVPAVIMGLIFFFIRRFYFRTARAIKRLEGVARSPVFSHLSTTLYGLPTIRAFRAEWLFKKEFEDSLDTHSSVWYLFLATSRWLGIVIDWISILFVSSVMINFLVDRRGDAVVGLAVTSAMMLTSMLQWGIRQSAELSNQMISVERVVTYTELPPEEEEPPTTNNNNNNDNDNNSPPPPAIGDWPRGGEIKIRNLSLVAPNGHFILRNVNCTFHAGEKVGVVGRTGAGKSSLLSVLFRLSEPTEGFVEIDGLMTSSVTLRDLRSRISIIPQEPVLFQGTVRMNLDPFNQFDDTDIWTTLRDVHLEAAVRDLPKGIYDMISEGGSNFSTGQKQLFCLARAVLRSNQILVLDEATANVDPETDALIQRTLRTSFGSCTVITIAHRLHTVMDSDRILVLDAGQVVEFDDPERLLSDRTSALYALAQQTGKAEAANLLHIARLKGTQRSKQRRNNRSSAFPLPLLSDIVQEEDDDLLLPLQQHPHQKRNP